jgi:hypothetical protein
VGFQDPLPFFSLVREIFPEDLQPTLTHKFFSLLHKKVKNKFSSSENRRVIA